MKPVETKSIPSISQIWINLKRLLALVWRMDSRLTVFFFLAVTVASLTPILTSFAMKFLLDGLVGQIQGVAGSVPFVAVAALGAFYLASAVGNFISWGLRRVYLGRLFRYRLQNELTRRFYQKTVNLDLTHLEDPQTQNLISKARDNLTWRPPIFLASFIGLFGELVAYVLAALILVSFGWWIPLVITVSVLPRLFLRARCGTLQWSAYNSTVPEARRLWYLMNLFASKVPIQEMRIFQAQTAMMAKFREFQEHVFQRSKSVLDEHLRFLILSPLLETSLLFAIAYWLLPEVTAGVLTVGSFSLLISLSSRLNKNTSNVALELAGLYENNLYIGYLFDVFDLPRLIREIKNPVVLKKIAPPRIEFKNVSFRYPSGSVSADGAGPLVLKNISFIIEPGQHVALVGPNGAGKTTIIKLLCRFYDVTEGEILVNGVDLKKLKLSNWRRFLGTLFQEFVRYHMAVRENIALGGGARGDEKRLIKAARDSGAYEFIETLPDGFDQMLGRRFEGGRELSSGQWQKLALARAFYHQPPLLVLDEPTSALDSEAEYEVFNNLLKSYKNKGLIFVSHRFSTVRNADRIMVIDRGEIIERGTHKKLLERGGKYATMFRCQAEGYR